MGIIGCPENPVSTNFSYPIDKTNDVEFGLPPEFPQELRLFTTDSRSWRPFVPAFINMDIGSAVNHSRFRLLRNSHTPDASWCDITWSVQFASDSTFSATPWEVTFPIPLTPYDYSTGFSDDLPIIGQWMAFDSVGLDYAEGAMFLGGGPSGFPGRFALGDDAGSITGQLQQGTPFTFTDGDILIGKAKVRVTLP